MQLSLWPDERGQLAEALQLPSKQKPRTRRQANPSLETFPVTLWEQEPRAKPRTIAELQDFVENFQYQPRPVAAYSLHLEHTARQDVYLSGYEIVSTNPQSNLWSARENRAEAIVSLSGGLGSAVAAERAIPKHGRENVLLCRCKR